MLRRPTKSLKKSPSFSLTPLSTVIEEAKSGKKLEILGNAKELLKVLETTNEEAKQELLAIGKSKKEVYTNKLANIEILVELDRKFMDRIEGSLADDETFREKVVILEKKYGKLVNDETRKKLNLEKLDLYGRENQKNLEEMVRHLNNIKTLATDTLEILNNDTDKLKAAFVELEEIKTEVKQTRQAVNQLESHDIKKKIFLVVLGGTLFFINLCLLYSKLF